MAVDFGGALEKLELPVDITKAITLPPQQIIIHAVLLIFGYYQSGGWSSASH